MDRSTLDFALPDETASARFGEDIAAVLAAGDVLALSGDLGAGKTTLARGVIRALAGDPELEVPSPTFTLVQAYAARLPVWHVDLYRLSGPDELEELGLDEAAGGGVVVVEWPERAESLVPADAIRIHLGHDGTGRHARVSAPADRRARIERSLAVRAFLDAAGLGAAHRRHLVGDASTRAYETITTGTGEPLILMNAPAMPDGPPIRDGLPYSRIAHLAESVVPFVAIDEALREAGFAAPAIHARDLDAGLLLVENLGSEGLLDAGGEPVPERYRRAAELLAAMHGREWPRAIEVAPGTVHRVPRYDRPALAIETELLVDWYLPAYGTAPPDERFRAAFAECWEALFARLEAAETTLVLRDFHSPNLIWRGERQGLDRIGLIDFQDAVIGPAAYDVASLALDARATISPALEADIVSAYCTARESAGGFDRAAFAESYAIMAAQRNSKILGIFVRLARRDGKAGYLAHLPRIRDYLARALAHPALADLRALYAGAGIVDAPV